MDTGEIIFVIFGNNVENASVFSNAQDTLSLDHPVNLIRSLIDT